MKGQVCSMSLIVVLSLFALSLIFEHSLMGEARANSINFKSHNDGKQSLGSGPNNVNVYVVNLRDNTLSIISGQTTTVIGNSAITNKYPGGVKFGSPDGRNTYVLNLRDNTLSIISGQTTTVIGVTTIVRDSAGEIAFGLTNAKLPVSATHKAALSGAIFTESSKVAAKTIPSGTSPTRGNTNNNAKAVTTPRHIPMVPFVP